MNLHSSPFDNDSLFSADGKTKKVTEADETAVLLEKICAGETELHAVG